MPRRLIAAGCTLAVSCALALGADAGGSGSYAPHQRSAERVRAEALVRQLRVERAQHLRAIRVVNHVYGIDQQVQRALTLASITYGVPRDRLAAISWRESRWRPWAKNPHSTASGLFQFLDSTWAVTPQAKAGLSVFDPFANALGAAWYVSQHGWGAWRLTAH
jgi:soluble lytic murein transglycosylase-like protein